MTRRAALTYTIPQAADALGIGKMHCRQLIANGDLPALRIGRRIVIAKAALDRWVIDHAGDQFDTRKGVS